MSRHFAALALLMVATVSGCGTAVKLQYQKPAANNIREVAKQANDQYRYVQLASLYVRVAPANTTASEKPDKADQFVKPQKPFNVAAASARWSVHAIRPAASGYSLTTEHDAGATPKKARVKGIPAEAGGINFPARGTPTPTPTSRLHAYTSKLDPVLATTLIAGKTWSATVVPMPDETHALMVRGVSGFWKTTSISIARYDNSDMASSSRAKRRIWSQSDSGNLPGPRRAWCRSPAASAWVSTAQGNQPTKPLLPFSIKVPENGPSIGTLNDGWSYRFDYDSDTLPAGTVSFDEFLTGVDGQTVSYWPVMACRTATVTVIPPNKAMLGYQYSFNVIVASAAALRLQPVPIDGKLNPGAVCSASESGTTTAIRCRLLPTTCLPCSKASRR